MKPAQIQELRSQLTGRITDAMRVREHFATDSSVAMVMPAAVAYPAMAGDVQTVVRFAAAQTDGAKTVTLTARGLGRGTSGGALGGGLIVACAAYLNAVRQMGKDTVTVEPGATLGTVQQVLRLRGRRLALDAALDSATIGGLVATNAHGAQTPKYGAIGGLVRSLEVVLDDGSLITTRRLSRRELNRKKGLMTREGDIYRGLDGFLQDHRAVIKEAEPLAQRSSAGYRLVAIKGSGGAFDLSQLMIGAEGTLGLITSITLQTEPLAQRTSLVMGSFTSLEAAAEALAKLQTLKPSSLEWVGRELLEQAQHYRPEILKVLSTEELPELVVWVSFDTTSHLRQNRLARRANRIMNKFGASAVASHQPADQAELMAVRQAAAAALWARGGAKQPLPLLDDLAVPLSHLAEALAAITKLATKYKVELAVWGEGEATLHLQPLLDLSRPKDRKTALALQDECINQVIKFGGSLAVGAGSGLLKAPFIERQFGHELTQLFGEVKQLCDPRGIFSPQVKLGARKKDIEGWLRHDAVRQHQHDYPA